MEYSQFLRCHVKVNITSMINELKRETPRGKWYDDLFEQLPDPTYDLVGDREGELEECRDPSQFWIVSPLLAEALLKKGQLLTNEFGFWIWGREFSLDFPRPLTLFDCVFSADPITRTYQLESEVLTQIYKESLRS